MTIYTGRKNCVVDILLIFFGGWWKKLLEDVLISVSIAVKTKLTTHQVNSNGACTHVCVCVHVCGGGVCVWVYVNGDAHVYMYAYETL